MRVREPFVVKFSQRVLFVEFSQLRVVLFKFSQLKVRMTKVRTNGVTPVAGQRAVMPCRHALPPCPAAMPCRHTLPSEHSVSHPSQSRARPAPLLRSHRPRVARDWCRQLIAIRPRVCHADDWRACFLPRHRFLRRG